MDRKFREEREKALEEIQALEPAGIGARDVRECLMLQMESRGSEGGVAWKILNKHVKLLEMKQFRELSRVLGRPPEHIEIAIDAIRTLDPKPGLRYSGRLASDPPNTLAQGEAVLFAGIGSQTGTANRWGDYSDLTVDPVDDCTFWYTSEYLKANGSFNWSTRIASFKFPGCQ